jgi:hypothetical protein
VAGVSGWRADGQDAALGVAENTVGEQLLQQSLDLRGAILGLHADQGQQAGLDLPAAAGIHIDAGFGNALDQGNHDVEMGRNGESGRHYPG